MIDGAEKTLDAGEALKDYMQRVADWEKGGSLQEAVDSFAERALSTAKAIGDRNDRADIASRPGRRRNAKRRRGSAWFREAASCWGVRR